LVFGLSQKIKPTIRYPADDGSAHFLVFWDAQWPIFGKRNAAAERKVVPYMERRALFWMINYL
jgi:hypothetical protein